MTSKLSAYYILLDFISDYLVNNMFIKQLFIHFLILSHFLHLGSKYYLSLPSFQMLLLYRMQSGAEKLFSNNLVQLTAGILWNSDKLL
jgi:hypothetical protein